MSDINTLARLINEVKGNRLLSFSNVKPSEIDELLDARDSQEFERRWLELFNTLERRSSEIEDSVVDVINQLREVSFKAAFNIFEESDFSAFVSDDFELIARALVLGVQDNWLNGIWIAYSEGRFPARNIQELNGNLVNLIEGTLDAL